MSLYPNHQHIDLPAPALDADGLHTVLDLTLRVYYSTTIEQEIDGADGLEPRYVDVTQAHLFDVTIVVGAREVPMMPYLGADECARCEAVAQAHVDAEVNKDAATAVDYRAQLLADSESYLGGEAA